MVEAGSFLTAFEERQPAPWQKSYGLSEQISRWQGEESIWRNIALESVVEGKKEQSEPIPESVAPAVRFALRNRGIEKLFSHQAKAFELAQTKRDVVVATPTASGKSLCYNLPVLDHLCRDSAARALYLFPTKALSRDQEVSLRGFLSDAGIESGAITYDGDTPQDARRVARDRGGILITNPDMLHAGILPHHASWARFFANLRFVVIDELHMYRGVFGSHLSNVLRRLLRVTQFHGGSVQFLFSSATIRNPAEHAAALIGRAVELVDENGAPSGSRRVLLYNPPIVNAELGLRASYIKSAVRLATDLVRSGVSTLVFGQSRNQVEVMLKYLRDRLKKDQIEAEAVQGYRGGYLPDTRRRIENGLRAGEVRCVVATNALELGIDIGSLEAVVCAGYPGTMAGLWQRFGRGGRRHEESLALLVTSSEPLNQFIAREPQRMISAPVEEARVDPDNVEILIQHLKCAAFELPFEEGETFGDVPTSDVGDALGFLAEHHVLRKVSGRGQRQIYHWSTDAYPASNVSLRSVGWDNFAIIDLERERTIAEMDFRSTHTMLHEQAIYQHEGEQYQVEHLDYENHKAFVRKVKPDYYTTAMTNKQVTVLAEQRNEALTWGGAYDLSAGLGEVNIVERVIGFKKIKYFTHENVGYGQVQLPEIQKPTTAFWLTVPEGVLATVSVPRSVMMDALSGYTNALHAVASVGLMMDPHDLGRALVDEPGLSDPVGREEMGRTFEPTIYLYDSVAGGVGLASRLWQERENLIRRSRQLVAECGCADGCPGCIGPSNGGQDIRGPSGEAGQISRKTCILRLLSVLNIH